ncbi:MAG: hypothetical protein AAFS13_08805, partial [Pseudomonadota bacterium]
KLRSASHVSNTFVSFGKIDVSRDAGDDSVINLYKEFAESGGKSWIDIVSPLEFFSGRFESIAISSETLAKNPDFQHIVRIVRHSIPVLNFGILYYDDKDKDDEVIFGWLYSDQVQRRRIFRSSDETVVQLFEDYFKLLTDHKIQHDFKVEYTRAVKQRLIGSQRVIDRRGRWITAAVRENFTLSYGLIDIEFTPSGVNINGKVKGFLDGSLQYYRIFHSDENTSYTDRKIFLEYFREGGRRSGICVYRFVRVGDDDEMFGYIIDDKLGKCDLFGLRVADTTTEMSTIDVDIHRGLLEKMLRSKGIKNTDLRSSPK